MEDIAAAFRFGLADMQVLTIPELIDWRTRARNRLQRQADAMRGQRR